MHETFDALKADFEKAQDSVKVVVEGGGSRTGVMAVSNGTAQIGMSSFAFDLDSILGSGHGIEQQVVAYDGIVLISNEANPLGQLTAEQILGIFNGSVGNWSQIGGNDGVIKPIIRDENSGTQQFFTDYFGIDAIAPTAEIASENSEIVLSVSRDPHGIGFIGFAYFTDRVKSLLLPSVHGTDTQFVSPSFQNVNAGSYPLTRSLRIYFRDAESPEVSAFLEYLGTQRARYVMEAHGMVFNRALSSQTDVATADEG